MPNGSKLTDYVTLTEAFARIDELRCQRNELQEERDDARDAARWCFERVYRQSEALEKWPWLGENNK